MMESSLNLDVELSLPFDYITENGNDIDFVGIDDDLNRFQTDDIIKQALGQGVDLRGYSGEIETELREVEMDSVREYVSQSGKVLELHHEIQSCDAILSRMQEMLLGFQADLCGISDEIRHLQDESISLNVRLKNRRAAENYLGKFLGNVLVPSELASVLCNQEINEQFIVGLSQLSEKLKYVQKMEPDEAESSLDFIPAETVAAQEVRPILEKLRIKACARIREYLLSKISELRKPKTNVQIIQKTALLKYKNLMQFIAENAPEMAEEVRHVYIESMGRTIFNLFKAYHAQLVKLELEVATRTDLIAVEEAAMKALFSTKVDLTKRGDAFSLGDRDKVLEVVDSAPILLHVAQAENERLPYEVILRSVLKHLIDSATSEYLFTLDFFKDRSQDTFNRIFERTLSLCVDNLNDYLYKSHDAIGLLLMIKLVHFFRLVMQRRRIPSLELFFDRFNVLLWPRFKSILDANLRSVSSATAKKLGSMDLTSHYITRRYAEFTASLLALQSGLDNLVLGIGGEEMLLNDLAILRSEMIKLLQRLAGELHPKKSQVIFLINNYDQVLTVFHERHIVADESTKFEELLATERANFVDEELKQRYGRLIVFVQSNENLREDDNVNENLVGILVRDFAATWKSALEEINQEVLSSFSSFRNGMEVLKQVLTQLLLYYTRFQEIIRRHWRKPPAFAKDIISTQAILLEIKKYSTFYAV